MSEKYIHCPACNRLTMHRRIRYELITRPEAKVWCCNACNPPLEDYSAAFSLKNEDGSWEE